MRSFVNVSKIILNKKIKINTSSEETYFDLQTVHYVLSQVRVGGHEDRKRRLGLPQTEPAEQQLVAFGFHRRRARRATYIHDYGRKFRREKIKRRKRIK